MRQTLLPCQVGMILKFSSWVDQFKNMIILLVKTHPEGDVLFFQSKNQIILDQKEIMYLQKNTNSLIV